MVLPLLRLLLPALLPQIPSALLRAWLLRLLRALLLLIRLLLLLPLLRLVAWHRLLRVRTPLLQRLRLRAVLPLPHLQRLLLARIRLPLLRNPDLIFSFTP